MHVNSRFVSMVHVVATAAALGGLGHGGRSALAQTTYIVNTLLDSQDVVPGDGICLDANGLCSLRAAIMEANANAGVVNIRFAVNGTHTLTIAGTDDACRFGDLDINPTAPLTELNILGNGIATTVVSAAGLPAGQPDRVFHVLGSAPAGLTLQLSGMTIRQGRAQGATGSDGGGVRVQGGRLLIDHVEIRECFAMLDGGGLWSDRSVTVVPLSPFVLDQNTAGDDGGGMYIASPGGFVGSFDAETNTAGNRGGGARFAPGTTAVVTDAVMQFNQATQGGGLANSTSTTIDFVIAAQNRATGGGNGGAIANQNSGSITIGPLATFLGNTADNGGGAVNNQFGCSFTIAQAVFRSNSATNLGGAVSNAGNFTVSSSEFSSNTTNGLIVNVGGGGAIFNQNAVSNFRAVNCTFSANSAPFGYGGGIENDLDGKCELSACTFRENRAGIGEALFNGNSLGTSSSMQIVGSILDSLPAPPGNNVVAAAPITSLGFNINVDGTGMLPAPGDQFGTIAAPIFTQLSPLTPCGHTQAHFPIPGSPAIDRGACWDVAGNVLTIDQCGSLRPLDGDGNGIAACDVGAIEAPAMPSLCPTCPGDVNADNFVDGRDAQQFVACWLGGTPAAPGCGCADMNGDGLFDPALPDLPVFVAKLLNDPATACP